MSLRINEEAPNFTAETTQGTIEFHKWIGDGWAILFSHPKDFTPVCTTELGYMAGLQPEFAKRNTKVIGLSVDPVSSHGKWAGDIEETQGHKVNYPMIGDPELKIAKLYDMLPADSGNTSEGRTAANNATAGYYTFTVTPVPWVTLGYSTLSFDVATMTTNTMKSFISSSNSHPDSWSADVSMKNPSRPETRSIYKRRDSAFVTRQAQLVFRRFLKMINH